MITIPEEVITIGDYSFNGCSGLTTITIPNSVTSIGQYAFSGCTGLTMIAIPNGVTSIKRNAFLNCSVLATISFPSSIGNVGEDAFKGTAWYERQPNGLVYAGNVIYKYKGIMPDKTKLIIEDERNR